MENQTDIDNLELIDEDQNEEVLEDETKENNMFDTVIDVIDNEDNLDNDEIIETISNDDTTKEEIKKTSQEENSVQEENNTNEENQEEQDSSNDSKDIKNSPYYKVLLEYGEDITDKEYITNPAIGREKEIQELIVILLTPEKSGILVGKPGIGKTAIVE